MSPCISHTASQGKTDADECSAADGARGEWQIFIRHRDIAC
jgi:hypothetical protein